MRNRDEKNGDESQEFNEAEKKAKEMLREMNKGGDEKKSGMSEAERDEMIEEEEAKTRQIYDPGRKIFDDRKRRVTDLSECSRVKLSKLLSIQ